MAFTDRFASVAGAGAHDGSNEANAWTLLEAMTNMVAEDWTWGKFGAHKPGATLLPSGSGDTSANKRMVLKGYNTTFGDASAGNFVSDMDPGQPFYQSPEDALENGIDTTKAVEVDAEGGAFPVVNLQAGVTALEGVEFYNFYFHNTDGLADNSGVRINSTSGGVSSHSHIISNCKMSDVYRGIEALVGAGPNYGVTVEGCYIQNPDSNAGVWSSIESLIVLNTIVKGNEDAGTVVLIAAGSSCFQGCIVLNGNNGVQTLGPTQLLNNTIYNQNVSGIWANKGSRSHVLYAFNNIIMPKPGEEPFRVEQTGTGGTIVEDFNCVVDVNGDTVSTLYRVSGGSVAGLIGNNDIQLSPQFINAPTDFRLQPNSPCLNIGNGRMSIGGWNPFALPIQERRSRQAGTPIFREFQK